MNANQKWLQQQETLRIECEAQAKPAFFDTFDAYVKAYPAGEHWRHMVQPDYILVATYQDQSCLEGDYLIAHVLNYRHYQTGENTTEVVVNDGDDGYMRKKCPTPQHAQQELENLKLLAPFYLSDLRTVDYYHD